MKKQYYEQIRTMKKENFGKWKLWKKNYEKKTMKKENFGKWKLSKNENFEKKLWKNENYPKIKTMKNRTMKKWKLWWKKKNEISIMKQKK